MNKDMDYIYGYLKSLTSLLKKTEKEVKDLTKTKEDIASLKAIVSEMKSTIAEVKKIDVTKDLANLSVELVNKMAKYHIKDGYWYVGDKKLDRATGYSVKGDKGYTPIKGKDYFDGKDGKTPIKGKDYKDGKDGYTPIKNKDYFDGKDGYTPIKGKDYFDGVDGLTPDVPNVTIGKVKTINPGEDAVVETRETKDGIVLDFYIPRGVSGRGNNAKINGYNTVDIKAGTNVTIDQVENELTINSTGGGTGTSDHAELTNLEYENAGHTGFEPAKGDDDNYVTDAEKTVIGNTSGTNSGDNAVNTLYSGLATSKQDTLVSGTNIKTINSTSLLGSGDIAIADEKVKYDAGDTTSGYVADKIVAGTGISVAEGSGATENKLVITNDNPTPYTLPTASTSMLGGVKIDGTTVTINEGIISAVTGGSGDVTGPASSTDNNIAVFDGITGKVIKDGGSTIAAITGAIPTDYVHDTGDTMTGDLTMDGASIVDAETVGLDTSYTVTGSEATGKMFWDTANHTASVVLENGVVGQLFQEQHTYGKNTSGVNILNGQAVSITSVGGSFTTFELTDVTDATSAKAFVGIATQDININDFGYITISGLVRDIDTDSWTEGATLYVDCVTPGNLSTSVPSDASCYVVSVGKVEYKHAIQGKINVVPIIYPKIEDLSGVDGTALTENGQLIVYDNDNSYFDFTKNINDYMTYSGFENRTDSTYSIVSGTGVLTLEPVTTSYNIYANGYGKITISAAQTVTITDDQTITYVYLDNTGTLQKSANIWDLSGGINSPAFIVFKDGTNYAVTDERHGYNRNREWHKWAHFNIGAMYNYGLGGTFDDNSISVVQGVIYDEDLIHDTAGTRTTTSLWYRNATDGMRMTRNSVAAKGLTGGILAYDDGDGTLAEVDNNKYVTNWVYATGDDDEPIYTVIGQNNSNTLTRARNVSSPIINLSTVEWKLIYRVIYQRNSGTPSGEFIEATDFRTVQTGVPTTPVSPTSHSILTDRDLAGSHPATAITNTPAGNISATDVQGAINELDTEKVAVASFTTDGGILVATGTGTFAEETGATLRTSIGCDEAGTDNSTNVTLNASATTGGLSIIGQEISNQAATNAQNGYMTSTLVGNIETNNAKVGYTDELAQDAVGGMVDSSLTYTDGTPELKVTNPVTPAVNGFTITAGTTPKTLTVPLDASVSGTNTGDQDLSSKQDVLVNQTNIKSINGTTLLGSGDLTTPNTTYTAGDFNHNDLANLNAGDDYEHITQTQKSALHPAVTIGTANGLSLSTQALSLAAADTDTTGALTDTDWDTFNNKQDDFTITVAAGGDIQTALDEADTAGGGTVAIADGTYSITTALTIPSNTKLLGIGDVIIQRGAAVNNLLRNEADGTTGVYAANENIRVENITFDANNTTYAGNTTTLAFGHANNIQVVNCRFIDMDESWHQLEINGCKNVLVDNCDFDYDGTTEALQLDLMLSSDQFPWFGPYDDTTCDTITIQNCNFVGTNATSKGIGNHSFQATDTHNYVTITGCSFEGFQYAISQQDTNNMTIEKCNFINNFYAISQTNQSNNVDGWNIINNKCDGGYISSSGENRFFSSNAAGTLNSLENNNFVISGNDIHNCYSYGIAGTFGENINIVNNNIYDCGKNGIYFYGGSNGVITNNTFDNNYRLGTYYDIRVGGNASVVSDRVQVSNNIGYKGLISTNATDVVFSNNIFDTSLTNSGGTDCYLAHNLIASVSDHKPALLWTNSSPTGTFVAQTVTVDLSDYDSYEILWRISSSNGSLLSSGVLPVGVGTRLTFPSAQLYRRIVTSSSTSNVVFDVGEYFATYGGSSSTDNSQIIPLYIIGHNTGMY